MNTTDYTTYPDDRHTRQTPAQRKRKMESARLHTRSAVRDLLALCEDFSANGYRLSVAERDEWREAARLHGALVRALGEK